MWNKILSYVIITVSGLKPERFINICTKRNIRVWGIRSIDKNTIEMCMGTRDFKKNVRNMAVKSKCRVRILKKCGIIIKLYRYRKRKFLYTSLAAAVLLIIFLCSMLWDIRIEGVSNIDKHRTKLLLGNMGIRPGVFMHNIDNGKLAEALMDNQPGVSWVGVKKKGTVLTITIAKRQSYEGASDIPEDVQCDIIAAKDAVVSRIVPERGTATVTIDTTVMKGQKLIEGYVVQKSSDGKEIKIPVHARGIVKGIVWYSVEIPVETEIERMVTTGNVKVISYLNIFGVKVSLSCNKISYEDYSSVTFEKYVTLPGGKEIPIGSVKTRAVETRKEIIELTGEEALQAARLRAMEELDTLIPDDGYILDTIVKIIKREEGTFLYMACECEESIGTEVAVSG